MGGKRIWVGLLTGKARATLSPRPPRFLTPELTVLSEPGLKGLPAGSEGQRPTAASSSWGPQEPPRPMGGHLPGPASPLPTDFTLSSGPSPTKQPVAPGSFSFAVNHNYRTPGALECPELCAHSGSSGIVSEEGLQRGRGRDPGPHAPFGGLPSQPH